MVVGNECLIQSDLPKGITFWLRPEEVETGKKVER